MSPCQNSINSCNCLPLKLCYRIHLTYIRHIQEVMRYQCLFLSRHLCRPNIQPTVHLPRIRRNNLPTKTLRQTDTQGTLSRSCRTQDNNESWMFLFIFDQGSMMKDEEEHPRLVVVLGPTASGKSTLGIGLAQRFGGEIVSADSRQVYRGLDIGTAKVTAEEQALVAHHLLDVADVREVYTVAQFQRQAIAAIDAILARGHHPFLVGGSPHYIQAVVDNLEIPAIAPQPDLRAELEARSLEDLLKQLEELDPQSAAVIDRNNRRDPKSTRLKSSH